MVRLCGPPEPAISLVAQRRTTYPSIRRPNTRTVPRGRLSVIGGGPQTHGEYGEHGRGTAMACTAMAWCLAWIVCGLVSRVEVVGTTIVR